MYGSLLDGFIYIHRSGREGGRFTKEDGSHPDSNDDVEDDDDDVEDDDDDVEDDDDGRGVPRRDAR